MWLSQGKGMIKLAKEKLTRSVLFPLTEEEFELIKKLAGLEGVKHNRNVLRRALKRLAQAHNLSMSEEAFADRQQGNTLPKKRPPANG